MAQYNVKLNDWELAALAAALEAFIAAGHVHKEHANMLLHKLKDTNTNKRSTLAEAS